VGAEAVVEVDGGGESPSVETRIRRAGGDPGRRLDREAQRLGRRQDPGRRGEQVRVSAGAFARVGAPRVEGPGEADPHRLVEDLRPNTGRGPKSRRPIHPQRAQGQEGTDAAAGRIVEGEDSRRGQRREGVRHGDRRRGREPRTGSVDGPRRGGRVSHGEPKGGEGDHSTIWLENLEESKAIEPGARIVEGELRGRQRAVLGRILREFVAELWEAGDIQKLMVLEYLFVLGGRNKDAAERFGITDEKAVAGIKFRAIDKLRGLARQNDPNHSLFRGLWQPGAR